MEYLNHFMVPNHLAIIMPESSETNDVIDPHRTVKIDYIKSNTFRVVHADGIFGGITPQGNIHMDIWNERPPIPQQIVHEFGEGPGLGDEVPEERKIRDADMIREVEVGVVFSLSLAKSMSRWLDDKIKAAENAISQAQAKAKQGEVADDGE